MFQSFVPFPTAPSNDGHLHAVDRRERIEEAVPALAAVAPNPELTGRRSHVERGRLQVINVERIAEDGEVGFLFRQAAREPLPGAAAVLAAPNGRSAVRTGARGRGERHD